MLKAKNVCCRKLNEGGERLSETARRARAALRFAHTMKKPVDSWLQADTLRGATSMAEDRLRDNTLFSGASSCSVSRVRGSIVDF